MTLPTPRSARLRRLLSLFATLSLLLPGTRPARAEDEAEERHSVRLQPHVAGVVKGYRLPEIRATVVHFSDLARLEAQRRGAVPPVRPLIMEELEEPAEPLSEPAPFTPSSALF